MERILIFLCFSVLASLLGTTDLRAGGSAELSPLDFDYGLHKIRFMGGEDPVSEIQIRTPGKTLRSYRGIMSIPFGRVPELLKSFSSLVAKRPLMIDFEERFILIYPESDQILEIEKPHDGDTVLDIHRWFPRENSTDPLVASHSIYFFKDHRNICFFGVVNHKTFESTWFHLRISSPLGMLPLRLQGDILRTIGTNPNFKKDIDMLSILFEDLTKNLDASKSALVASTIWNDTNQSAAINTRFRITPVSSESVKTKEQSSQLLNESNPSRFRINLVHPDRPMSIRARRSPSGEVKYFIQFPSTRAPDSSSLNQIIQSGIWISFPQTAAGTYEYIPMGPGFSKAISRLMSSAKFGNSAKDSMGFPPIQFYKSLEPQLIPLAASSFAISELAAGRWIPEDPESFKTGLCAQKIAELYGEDP